jgi:tetratricopeptide (TPR) repeat protein
VVSSQQIPGQLKQQFFTLANDQIHAQIDATPKDARAYVLGGSFLNDIGQVDQALPLLEKAHELSPTKQSISITLADNYLGAGKIDQALVLLKQAYESATDNFDAEFSYAVGLVVAGKESQARAMFSNDPKIFVTSQMANVYASLKQYSKSIDVYNELIGTSTTDVNLRASLAQVQYQAGMKDAAVVTLKSIEKDHPEYKTQIDAAIKQVTGSK